MTDSADGQVDYEFLASFSPKIVDVVDRSGSFWIGQRYVIERRNTELDVIGYVFGGSGSLQLDDAAPQRLTTGSVFHIGHARRFFMRTQPKDALAFYSIHFRYRIVDWRGANAILGNSGRGEFAFRPSVRDLEDALLEDEFRQTFEAWEAKAPGYEWRSRLGLLRIFQRMCQILDLRTAESAEDAHPINLAIDYVKSHLELPLDRGDVAARVGLSPGYFSTLFRKHTGHAFSQYVRNLRIDEAKRYLRESDMQVQIVARRVGFTDPFYFSRVFKDLVGVPPQGYRAM